MKLTVEKAVLTKTLARVVGIVERRTTIPMLSNILLSAGDGVLTITATDMDMEARATAVVDTATCGTCTVPALTLADIVKKLPDGAQVELSHSAEDDKLTVRSGRSRFSLATLDADEFPIFNPPTDGASFDIEAVILNRLIDSTRFAINHDDTRYYLNGIYLHIATTADGQSLRAAATDGHRLAQDSTALPDGAASMPGIILPRKAVDALRKLTEGAGTVGLQISDTKFCATIEGATDNTATVLTTKLIDGTFPDYQRVIPTGNLNRLEADSADLSAALGRVAAISSEKSRAVKLTLSKSEISLDATSPEHGTANEQLDAERANFTGAAIEIGFNSRYLMDAVTAAAVPRLRLSIGSPNDPCIITDAAQSDGARLFVVMPMRV
jgi:DNA polymerase-3 subunit beta